MGHIPNIGVAEAVFQGLIGADLTIHQHGGHRPGQIELGFLCRGGQFGPQPDSFMKGLHHDALDVGQCNVMYPNQLAGPFDSGMRPSAAGIALHFPADAIHHDIVVTDIHGPIAVFLHAQQRRDPAKSPGSHFSGHDAGHAAPVNAVFNHGGVIDVPHHGQIGGLIIGYAQCVPGLFTRQIHQVCGSCSAGYGTPGTASLVHFMIVVPASSHAMRHFVPHHHGGQKTCTAQIQGLGHSQGCWKNLGPTMTVGVLQSIVRIDAVGSCGVGKRRTNRRGADTV